ncbi:MAG: RagB/SusD family nutrient uptake outer membrane protein [Prevotellaceae bacterium]|nr:RagB/SusD family nutrient uptake outer membrane protein [Prevotellaceae bacterium]
MRFFQYITLAALTLAAMPACHDMLNQEPVSDYERNKFGRNTEEVNALVIACYAGMRKPLDYEWMLTELRSDNSVQGSTGSSSTSNLELNDLDMFRPATTHPSVYSYWYYTYQNVDAVNNTLEHLEFVDDSALREQIEGEALLIRSYHFFNLVRLYGPIFLSLKTLTPDEAKMKIRIGVTEVYGQLVADLKKAAAKLPPSYSTVDLGRATSWAAKGMLAKVYLTIDSLEEARVQLQDIIENGPHKLLDSYADVFSISNEMSSEILFAVRFKSGGVGMGSSFANWFAPTGSGVDVVNGNGQGLNYPTASINAIYATNDSVRRNTCIGSYTNKIYVKKYLSYVTVRYDAENDWPVLRYSDVLLMYAEVLAKLRGAEHGMDYLNMVYHRATGERHNPILSLPDFMQELMNERRRELAFENQRWFDLLRTGNAAEHMKNHIQVEESSFYNGYRGDNVPRASDIGNPNRLLLPIPQREIDTNNKTPIVQNVGY